MRHWLHLPTTVTYMGRTYVTNPDADPYDFAVNEAHHRRRAVRSLTFSTLSGALIWATLAVAAELLVAGTSPTNASPNDMAYRIAVLATATTIGGGIAFWLARINDQWHSARRRDPMVRWVRPEDLAAAANAGNVAHGHHILWELAAASDAAARLGADQPQSAAGTDRAKARYGRDGKTLAADRAAARHLLDAIT